MDCNAFGNYVVVSARFTPCDSQNHTVAKNCVVFSFYMPMKVLFGRHSCYTSTAPYSNCQLLPALVLMCLIVKAKAEAFTDARVHFNPCLAQQSSSYIISSLKNAAPLREKLQPYRKLLLSHSAFFRLHFLPPSYNC